jgi:uncharacterized circularly permuted ATP-grasp superfamily protein/uncharacterized alpha-E superfamily protein
MLPRCLADYPGDAAGGDLYAAAAGNVRDKWRILSSGLDALAADAGVPLAELFTRQIQELGMSFRVAGEPDERPWPLTPMPLVIGAAEWSQVEAGLVQRAELIEQVVADIYGPQKLVADGALPAAAAAGSRYFARNMVGRANPRPGGGHFLQVYAAELARGPKGQWRVLTDRLRLANGIGYALENRLALNRGTGALLGDIATRRLAGFFAELRAGMATESARENPRIALLTPGRFNQSYPEQAHLARYLGFPLVEGRDLVVLDRKLYVRTIAGPKRIDALWRWLDTNALDPLAFDTRSTLGVPDLFEAWAAGGVAIANRPGVEVLEAPLFAAFLPRLATLLLGDELLLPNVATWWCGQPAEAAHVADQLDSLIVTPAFGKADDRPVAPAMLAAEDRARLIADMARRPMDFCGQEIIHLSTTPVVAGADGATCVPRPFTLRAFVARGIDGGWRVMPGGLARLPAADTGATTLMGAGDLSADVCIVDDQPKPQLRTMLASAQAVRRGGGILASQAADNLFWFGRYLDRAEATVRVIRALLAGSIDSDTASASPGVQAGLMQLLFDWGALPAEALGGPAAAASRAALGQNTLPGTAATLLGRLREVGLALRDRFAPDFWRLASRPPPALDSDRPGLLLRSARELIERFSAMSGLVAEDMVRGPAWRFLELGRRVERGVALTRLARALTAVEDESEALSTLLDIGDSQITYRSRYLTAPDRAPVFDLLLLDPANPRSLAFQLEAIAGHLDILPTLGEDNLPELPLRLARAALGPFTSLTAAAIDPPLLQQTEAALLDLSEAIAARYFLPPERTEDGPRAPLLA